MEMMEIAEDEAIEIGTVAESELDTMLEMMCAGFGLPFDAAREVFYSDPYFEIENKRVLRVNGKVASCLTIVDTQCWIGESVVRLGGVAGVATRPEMQKRGYAGRLLEDTARLLRERGYALSALFPFSQEFYRRYGWEVGSYGLRYLTAPQNLPRFPETRHVRLASAEDVPELLLMYNRETHGRTLRCLRDEKRWKYLLQHIKQNVVYAAGDRVEGYILYEHRAGGELSPVSGRPLPPTLRILEMSAETEEAQRGLIGHLGAQTKMGCIEYVSTWANLDSCGLMRFPASAARNRESVSSVESVPAAMVRVAHLERLLEAMLSSWVGFQGSPALVMYDALAESGMSAALILGTGEGPPRVQEAWAGLEPDRFPDTIEGEAGAWAQVFVGHLSGTDACELGLLRPATARAKEWVGQLFPRRSPFLPTPDHF